MPHRRHGHRLRLSRVHPEARVLLLRCMRAPNYLIARAQRTWKPAAVDALLDPRRRVQRPKPPRVAR